MDYKKLWDTLKAESGYRVTKNFVEKDAETIKELMENIEERANNQKSKEVPDEFGLMGVDYIGEGVENEL